MKLNNLIFPEKIETDKSKLTDKFGRFIAEPFERGYGHTIGNSLRRILLSSLEGAAVTAVKIPGAPHEFSVVRGVKEDVMEIILNLKQLRFKMNTATPQILNLRVSKKHEVTANDFESNSNVEIINKNLVIAHLDPGAEFNLSIEVSLGRGYISAERNKSNDRSVDFIAVDAFFSPVTKVYYEVENARVGQVTDYDRLNLEISTDGSISPVEALNYSAKILKDSVLVFLNESESKGKEVSAEVESSEEKSEAASGEFAKGVENIGLSVRAVNCLKNAKIKTLGELVQKTEEDLLNYKNFGKVSLSEIKEKLEEMNLSLGMKI